MRVSCIVGVVVAFFGVATPVIAQQTPAPQPGVFVLSPNKCDQARIGELNDWVRSSTAPILNDLVREGRLMGWGVLTHAWGDEWNWVLYYTARDLNTFHAAFQEFARRLAEREPNFMQRLAGFCTEHKDNIYASDIPFGTRFVQFTDPSPGRERHQPFLDMNPQTQK